MENVFEGTGMNINGILFLSPAEAYEAAKKGAYIIDIREEYETDFKMYDVENLIYSPFFGFAGRVDRLPSDSCLIIADSTGNKSKEIYGFLKDKGFESLAVLAGGIISWERQGLPMKKDKSMQLSGSCICTIKTKVKRKSEKS